MDERRVPLVSDDILVLADDLWARPKRARHKVPAAWAQAGNHVLWVETPFASERRDRRSQDVRAVDMNLFVTTPPAALIPDSSLRRPWRRGRTVIGRLQVRLHIDRALEALNLRPRYTIIWQNPALAPSPMPWPGRTVYYASDLYVDPSGRSREERTLADLGRRVQLMFATSNKIADTLRPHHPRVVVVPHAVDLDWWRSADRREPADLARIPRPRLLFVGVGTVKFDLELWRLVAERQPCWHLVTVGPFDRKLLETEAYRRLVDRPNVHLLGERPFASLPGYLAHADVLSCPYLVDPVRTASGLPNKFYEYAAAGKPILSTPFTDFEETIPQLHVRTPESWPSFLDEVRNLEPVAPVDLEAHSYLRRVSLQQQALQLLDRVKTSCE
ncbi:MAG: glycosyltransferase family 1 protein [Myxococcales bacterium]|nr:glycosyltransferase family 1 protein [Myxococcales bacterium]